ncbi:HK97 family phage prohead protease [Sphingomonas sp. R1]|uniref:HK97 family phage prohead protease n=1 Tax=Sphingomonas sp. R1 TaxID=399176 RepID=UPI002224B595|nr:HK97 family phage prohead protease [Sphingomonas sp. R1]UYY77787.1 HK97 family phage prohead protease [Sphingomonas sp. R1]
MDRLAFDLEVKLAGDDSATGLVEGYASVYGILDRGGDIVMPGAFKQSLADWRRKKAMPPMLWQHDSGIPVGVWNELAEDDKGLRVKGSLVLDVPAAAAARALMMAGAVKGLSIGYRTLDDEIDRQTGVRRIKKAELWEVSLVTFPMLPEAQITGVKSIDDRSLEQALRDEGLSHREAKLAVSVVRKHVLRDEGRQPDPRLRDGVTDAIMALRKSAQLLRD